MYAIVETGGKQYQMTLGEYVDVERLPFAVGEQVTLDRVLMVNDQGDIQVGRPLVEGAQVVATVVGQRRYRKVIVFHYVPKKRQRTKRGHRQYYTRLRIEQIQA